jgi:hypothetical protein
LKAYTKGEHMLRVEATVHNTRQLGCGRAIERFPQIVTRLAGMTERFCTTLDCVTTGYLPDGTLDQLPLPARLGRTRVGGIDLNKPRMRAALAAVLTLSAAPAGFTVADLAAKVQAMTGPTGYTIRQAAYDLRKLRGKELLVKPGRSRRYQVPPPAARTIAGLLTPARPGHRPHPGRYPQPPAGPQARPLDRRRPRLRDLARRHAGPLRRPRHHNQRRGIDNILSIRVPQAPSTVRRSPSVMRPLRPAPHVTMTSVSAGHPWWGGRAPAFSRSVRFIRV